uniref:Major facilitator superfamily (MFS) profile domain-containing protein n=2 Tax=Alexandrium monilatum TaxID=311494 RepID=A0A7S4UPN2_9DINO
MFASPSIKKYILTFFLVAFLALILFVEDSPPDPASDIMQGCRRSDIEDFGISLLQENHHVVARSSGKESGAADIALLEEEEVRMGCVDGLGMQPEDPTLDDTAFLPRLAKPYRLRTLGVAIIGFGLLTLDSSSAVLLAF